MYYIREAKNLKLTFSKKATKIDKIFTVDLIFKFISSEKATKF